MRLTPAQLRAAVLTLDLTWSGRVFRFASEAVQISVDGTVRDYAGGLVLSWEDFAEFAGSSSRDSIALGSVVFPVDVADWHAKGRDLVDAPAVLSLWAEGMTGSERQVLMRGTVDAVEYGSDGEPVELTMRPPSTEDGAIIPPPEAVVTTDTWSNAGTQEIGRPYPIVFGKPGLGGGNLSARGGSPARLVDSTGNGVWLISDDHVAATSVVVIDPAGATSETLTVSTTTDSLGRRVSTVAGTGGNIAPSTSKSYFVDWSASGGGVRAIGETTAATGAGDIAIWLLSQSTAAWDEGAWRAVRRRLNQYRLAFYCDPTSPLKVLRSEVLPLLPVTEYAGPAGIAPVLWRWDASEADAVLSIEEGRNAHRASMVQIDRDGLANEIRMSYAPRADDGEPARTLTVTGRPVGTSVPDVFEHPACKSSLARYGQRAINIDTPNVYDSQTAARILVDTAAARALPRKRIAYDCDADVGHLHPGSVVLLTDSGLGLASRVALVEAREFAGGMVRLSLVLIAFPARDSRPT